MLIYHTLSAKELELLKMFYDVAVLRARKREGAYYEVRF